MNNLNNLWDEEEKTLQAFDAIQRKKQGIYFTPAELVQVAVESLGHIDFGESVFDPACGTGNLLVAFAERLPVFPSLEETLGKWGDVLFGLDINVEFVVLAKKKIINLALMKSGMAPLYSLDFYLGLLKNIRHGDFFVLYPEYVEKVDHVLMNPPFCHIDTPKEIEWTSGRSNAAALFVSYAAHVVKEGGKVVGILPDVLRGGSRYKRWRSCVAEKLIYTDKVFGSFQKGVQVDVYILSGKKSNSDLNVALVDENRVVFDSVKKLGDHFDVSVGPVVPHRDKKIGTNSPFAHAKGLPPWGIVKVIHERITHSGRKILPPFVAVRRTSSPKDKYRVIGTIVDCNEAVAVENHIIILSPKNGSIEECLNILHYLQSSIVNEYINARIRCRHLTVGILKEIPLERGVYGSKEKLG